MSANPNPSERSDAPPLSPTSFGRSSGNWKPTLTLLILAPTIGELLSGSSPPVQFFNPIAFILLVALYGCGALLVREFVVRRKLNVVGLLMLGAAYGILEEGLTCKSFFNPNWTDTGFLSVYGRAWGVNWVWATGLTAYHMVVSITVPIFMAEALFPARAREPWLRRRGWVIASTSLAFVVLLGFWAFDNRQFHLTEIKDPLGLATRWASAGGALDRFIAGQFNSKNRQAIQKAVDAHTDSPDLRHALQDELNRLLSRPDLYAPERFPDASLSHELKIQSEKPPKGDKLIVFNRGLLESAFPTALAHRVSYPFRPPWWWSLGCVLAILGLVLWAVQHPRHCERRRPTQKPWRSGLGFTAAFVVIGFVMPSLVEHGVRIPWMLDCVLWGLVAILLARRLRTLDGAEDELWRRGLWAVGVLTPWVLFALVLGLFVGMMGAKSFSGMTLVSVVFALAILKVALRFRSRLLRIQPSAPGQSDNPCDETAS